MSELNPFVIRGHHLNWFAYAVKSKKPAHELANTLINVIDKDKSAKYISDVLGETTRTREQYAERITDVFSGFMNLENDNPVHLVISKPDGICGSCITGAHCHEPRRGVTGNMRTDLGAINEFNILESMLTFARQLPLADDLPVYMDGDQQLETTAIRTRVVLAQWGPREEKVFRFST